MKPGRFPTTRSELEAIPSERLALIGSEPGAPPYLVIWARQELETRRKIGTGTPNTPDYRLAPRRLA